MAILGAILAGCTAVPPAASLPEPASPAETIRPLGLAWSSDGTALLLVAEAAQGCVAERWDASGTRLRTYALPFCPASAIDAGGRLLLRGEGRAVLVSQAGVEEVDGSMLDLAGEARLELRGGRLTFLPAGHAQRVAGEIRGARLVSPEAAVAVVRDASGDSLVRFRTSGEPLTIAGPFAEIDSIDVSPDGRDVVFSARRDAGFDVGLIASDGGETRWIPADPLDERMVSWAPRGNKVTYRIDTASGSVLRSVHVPTGFQLSVPAGAHARELAWEPRAERFAVRLESASAAGRIDVLRYGGEERRTLVPPSAAFTTEAHPLPGVPGGVAFPPENLRYDETVPVVIWVESATRTGWSAPRFRLHQNRRSGTIVVPAEAAEGPALWNAVGALPWVDPREVFVVTADPEPIVRSITPSVAPTILTSAPLAAVAGDIEVRRLPEGNLDGAAAEWLERALGRATRSPAN